MLRDLRDEPYLRMEAKLLVRPAPDDSSELELHLAAGRGELDSVKQLIENKELNPLQIDKNGFNALHYTAVGGHLPVMKYFVEDQGTSQSSMSECEELDTSSLCSMGQIS
jgi:ankyrin repeat protein